MSWFKRVRRLVGLVELGLKRDIWLAGIRNWRKKSVWLSELTNLFFRRIMRVFRRII